MGKRYAMHAPRGYLDDSDGGGGEEGLKAGPLDVGGFLSVGVGAEAELAGLRNYQNIIPQEVERKFVEAACSFPDVNGASNVEYFFLFNNYHGASA